MAKPQTIATAKYQEKAGYKAKTYKLKAEVTEAFAKACEKSGRSQAAVLTELMIGYTKKIRREKEMMTIHGREITDEDMDMIASYMDDEKREQVHAELAPCTPEAFIKRYLELDDPEFEDILRTEFKFKMN